MQGDLLNTNIKHHLIGNQAFYGNKSLVYNKQSLFEFSLFIAHPARKFKATAIETIPLDAKKEYHLKLAGGKICKLFSTGRIYISIHNGETIVKRHEGKVILSKSNLIRVKFFFPRTDFIDLVYFLAFFIPNRMKE